MGLTLTEAFADVAPILSFADNVKVCVAKLPPKETRNLTDYAIVFDVPATSPLYQLLAIIDTVEGQIKS